jgi:hypothetical protein
VVEEGNLKVHIAALRPTLADGQSGRRYLATIPGRGYRFVAPVVLTEEPTFREPLRPAGEHVQRRAPEERFPAWLRPSTDEALGFPSVQIFVERVASRARECSAMWARRSQADDTRRIRAQALSASLLSPAQLGSAPGAAMGAAVNGVFGPR